MARRKVPHPVSGGVMLSYKCTAECRHCMYACSPKWDADWMTEADLAVLLSKLAPTIAPSPWGADTMSLNHGLHFTGGEPFLNFKLLLRAVEMATDYAVPSLFVETNGFWAGNDDATRGKLEQLKTAGLHGIMISVNPFYAEYVPFERTERCIRISGEVFGANVMVYQRTYYQLFRELGLKDRIAFEDYVDLTKRLHLSHQVELFLMGRAAKTLRDAYPKHPARRFFAEPCRPTFLRAWHNHFDNYGNIVAGYCGGISLGDWHDLDALTDEGIDLDAHPVLRCLVDEDIRCLLHLAQDFGYTERDGGYVSKCDLCLDLRSHLVANGNFAELVPKTFYAM